MNPCGFPLLPAFLSFYLGADEQQLPRAATRVLQGLLVGALVTAGFVGLFALVSLPVSFGVALVAQAVPWAGLVTGALLALAGLLVLSGKRLPVPLHLRLPARRERRFGAMLLFGVGYGAASLGCTLPLFLSLVGASAGGGKVTVFVAYAVGTAVVLMALSVVVALAREGVVRGLRALLPHMNWIAGLLLLASGGYLFYYWARLQWGDSATVADDPIVSLGVRFSGDVERFAHGRGSILVTTAGAIVALALVSAIVRRRRSTADTGARMTRVPHLALLAALALAGAGCAAGTSGGAASGAGPPAAASVPSPPRQLTDLRDIGQLRTLFNGASGEPRLIILASPT